ncbi:MAG: DNA repair protein RecO [Saprospiraceae bacterium]|nr:DNA repair protein RecO [Saprospiraceae bacterium]
MQITETEGIVFRTVKYSETSIILDMYTRASGLRTFMVNGVRSSKNKSGTSVFQVMNQLSLSFYDKEGDSICRIKEYEYAFKYVSLMLDVIKSSVGLFLIECTRNSIRERECNESLYDFITQKFRILDGLESHKLSHFYLQYLLDLAGHLGFKPMNNYSEDTPFFNLNNGKFENAPDRKQYQMDMNSSKLLYLYLRAHEGQEPESSKADKQILIDYLLQYYLQHLEGFRPIKSLEVLRTIMQ